MTVARPVAALICLLGILAVSGCGRQRIQTAAQPGQTLVALLPDPGDGNVGRAVVSNSAGSSDLASARESTTVSPNQPPAPVTILSEADVTRLFGDALSTLPLAAQHFILYFRFESEELTDESRALLPQILQAVRDRPFPDVAVVGHTDTTGTRAGNYELGLRRANTIRGRLVAAGIDSSLIEVTSHGEGDLLVNTADEVLEPRNRRVEITVR
jgi:outer membrane protein OmpA-like peptidoglycan-associated protein